MSHRIYRDERLRIEDCRVDLERATVSRAGAEVRLEPQVLRLFVHLAERHGQVVTKGELIEEIWDGRFVGEETLTVAVYKLRKALGDKAKNPRFIETVPRRGYRWCAPVEIDAGPTTPAAVTENRRPVYAAVLVSAAALLLAVTSWVAIGAWSPEDGSPEDGAGLDQVDPEVRERYLKGEHLRSRSRPEGLEKAVRYLHEVVTLDPELSSGWAALAKTYLHMVNLGYEDVTRVGPLALKAARRAVDLEPDADSLTALGSALLFVEQDLAGAEDAFRLALDSDPDSAEALQSYNWLRSMRGDFDGAIVGLRQALSLSPLSVPMRMELAGLLLLAGRPSEAVTVTREAIELDPELVDVHRTLGWAYLQSGRHTDAFKTMRKVLVLEGAGDDVLSSFDEAYAEGGFPALESVYVAWNEQVRPEERRSFQVAIWRGTFGDWEGALEALAEACRNREIWLLWLDVHPLFEPLRSDARYPNWTECMRQERPARGDT